MIINKVYIGGFPDSLVGKESACNAGDLGSIPGLGRSSGEGIGYLLQYSGLENSMDCIVHGVAKNWTRLSDFHFQSMCVCVYIYIHTHTYMYNNIHTHICIITYIDETKETLFVELGGCTYTGAHFSLTMLSFIPSS